MNKYNYFILYQFTTLIYFPPFLFSTVLPLLLERYSVYNSPNYSILDPFNLPLFYIRSTASYSAPLVPVPRFMPTAGSIKQSIPSVGHSEKEVFNDY